MKKTLLFFAALTLIACTKKAVKDVEKGTTAKDVEAQFGKPSNKSNLFGSDYWRYDDYIVVFTGEKVDTVVTTDYLDKTTKELEHGLNDFSTSMDSLGKDYQQQAKEFSDVVDKAEKTLNQN